MMNIAEQMLHANESLKRKILRAKSSRLFSREDVANLSGIHINTVARFLSGGNLRIETIVQIAKAVDQLELRSAANNIASIKNQRRLAPLCTVVAQHKDMRRYQSEVNNMVS
ncbi:hypothetical protein N9L75_03800 [Porticoccaceae bacterium]|nr:hypothetical protein [Porticoccaceae bacterium]MDA8651680.1 hypothetical protein [Porticoccaceae bacterium]MDB2486880.1 hypothetical protein [Porticoccaceae bacterium]MDB2664396.1 hypothetical protein [Porticoccaceae bacterium]